MSGLEPEQQADMLRLFGLPDEHAASVDSLVARVPWATTDWTRDLAERAIGDGLLIPGVREPSPDVLANHYRRTRVTKRILSWFRH